MPPFTAATDFRSKDPNLLDPGESLALAQKKKKTKKKKPRHTLENIWPSFTLLLSTQWSTLASLVIKALGDSGKLAPRSWEVTPSSSFAEKYQIYC